jgi:FMN-dependent NADH-azoreductase
MCCASDPKITSKIPKFDDYDVIVIASPVWVGSIPTVLASWLKVCDFHGKTVIPLATANSQVGHFAQDIKEQAKNARVLPDSAGVFMAVESKTGNTLTSEVEKWLEKL